MSTHTDTRRPIDRLRERHERLTFVGAIATMLAMPDDTGDSTEGPTVTDLIHRHGLPAVRGAIKAAICEYLEHLDDLDGFLPGVYIRDASASVEAPKAFRDFNEFANTTGRRDLAAWSSRAFYTALAERGHSKRKTRGKWVIDGIRRAEETA